MNKGATIREQSRAEQSRAEQSRAEQYNAIDLFKFIAAFLIITIHCQLLNCFGEDVERAFVSTIPSLAVPFFFACSGFFFFKKLTYKNGKILNCKENRRFLFKYLLRISLLYLIWSVVYLITLLPNWYSTGWLSFFAFVDYGIAFFRSCSYYHLWYLLALIYATLAGYVLMMFIKREVLFVLSGLLYIFGMFTYAYTFPVAGVAECLNKISSLFPAMWNSLTRALPLMLIGYLSYLVPPKMTVRKNLLLFLASFAGLILEFLLINNFTDNHEKFSYIVFTLPTAYFLFNLSKNLNLKIDRKTCGTLRRMSTLMYCVHPLFLLILISFIDEQSVNSILRYLIVAASSALFSFAIVKLSECKGLRFLRWVY